MRKIIILVGVICIIMTMEAQEDKFEGIWYHTDVDMKGRGSEYGLFTANLLIIISKDNERPEYYVVMYRYMEGYDHPIVIAGLSKRTGDTLNFIGEYPGRGFGEKYTIDLNLKGVSFEGSDKMDFIVTWDGVQDVTYFKYVRRPR